MPSMVPAALRPHCCRHARRRRELPRLLLSQSRDRVLGHEPRYGQTPCPRVAGLLPACQPPASGADHCAAPPRRFSVHSPCVRARRRMCICICIHAYMHMHMRACRLSCWASHVNALVWTLGGRTSIREPGTPKCPSVSVTLACPGNGAVFPMYGLYPQ